MEENKTHEREILNDPKLCILILQIVTTILLLLGMVGLRLSDSGLYRSVRKEYYKAANDYTDVGEVLNEDKTEQSGNESIIIGEEQSEPAELEESTIIEEDTSSVTSATGVANENSFDLRVVQTSLSNSAVKGQSMIWPLTYFKKTSDYGYRKDPFTGKNSFHHGVDLAADKGSEISAAMDGTVSAVGVGKSYGNYILVRHNNKLSTLYAHCSKIVAKEGQKINQGDVIALVGSTGRSTGNHLHFEIRIDGERIDPLWLLP